MRMPFATRCAWACGVVALLGISGAFAQEPKYWPLAKISFPADVEKLNNQDPKPTKLRFYAAPARGLTFDQISVGQRFVSQSRTITEADVVHFAGVSGDYNPMHTDAEFAAGTVFRGRIAHGLLVQSVASGLAPLAVSASEDYSPWENGDGERIVLVHRSLSVPAARFRCGTQ